jgi:DNA repair protein RadD
MTIKLRWYQEEAINSIYNYFMTNTGNPCVGLPTGSGKTILPAVFIQRAMKQWPNQRFLLLTHIKELIEQGVSAIEAAWPNAPIGVYSAGLHRRDIALPIIFAGIQSAIKNPAKFGHRDLVWIDEVHMVSTDETSMYQTFLATMKLINPQVKFVGMSATLFRMGQGYIVDGGLFTDICYDMTNLEGFNKLIEQGYLCPLVPRRTHTELDVTNVGMAKGDFIGSQLQSAVDKQEITFKALKEATAYGHDRKSWLIFASGIEHSDHIASMLCNFGIDCASVHSKQKPEYNDGAIKAFRNGSLRAISNYGKLTTGFDHAGIDLIIMLRPTMSIPLWVQMLGRGTRPNKETGKSNCMVLDFARNVPRLGPINDPVIPNKKSNTPGDIPVKICEACGTYNHTKVRYCTNCGNEFSFAVKIVAKAGTEEIIRSDLPVVEYFDVDHAIYVRKSKEGKAPYIMVSYFSGLRKFSEFVFPESAKYGKHLFHQWWMQRHKSEPPKTTDEALKFVSELRCPKRIRVWCNKKYPEVLSCEY